MAEPTRPATADRRLAARFPDEDSPRPSAPWWRRRSGVNVVVALVVALGAGGWAAASAFGASGGNYRTATVATEKVDAVQTGVATIEPVAQASVAFPVSGEVASVNVKIGDPVTAGGTLASLDTQALVRTLHTKQAALAQAQLMLSKALSGQSIGVVGGGTGAGGANGINGGSGASSASASTAAFRGGTPSTRVVLTAASTNPQLDAAQQAVLAAQQHVDAALATAANALTSETTVCASFAASPPTTTTPPTSTTAPPPPDVSACQQAIAGVANAQSAVNDAQRALATAANALDALLAQLAATPPTTAPRTSPSTPPTGPGTGGSGGNGSSGRSGGGGSGASGSGAAGPSAADLVAAQRAVDAAAAAAAVAQQSIDQATISSPLAGTVVAVNLKVGDTVTADSPTEDVVVQGRGGYEVSTTVTVDDIPSVSVGQTATVVPDGTHRSLAGKVVAISVAPASTSTAGTLYRVVIGLTQPGAKLDDGATGTVAIVTKQAKAALAVPTSAITTARNRHFVKVLRGGTVTPTPVEVGVVGDTWTEITRGLAPGQQVVLADVNAALPSSAIASANTTRGTGPLGGFGGFGRVDRTG